MSIRDTRECINSILDGSINDSEFRTTNTFKLHVPNTLGNIDKKTLFPREAWADDAAFVKTRDKLAQMFIDNFKRYQSEDSEFDYSKAGPEIDS
jgi:phosphoenolpyruvate carboxykinase (ATP)